MDQSNQQAQQAADAAKQQGKNNQLSADYATAEVMDAARTAESLRMNDAVRDTVKETQTRDATESTRETAETRTQDAARPQEAAREAAPVDPATTQSQVAEAQMVIGSDNPTADTSVAEVVTETIVVEDDSQPDTATVDAAIDLALGDTDNIASDDAFADGVDD
ncbi:MAG: hypothetical protein AAB462_01780 [Patescibacteria group bacterium]